MPSGPNPSLLLAKAVGLAARADQMASSAAQSPLRDDFALVALAARDTRAWLIDVKYSEVATLRDIDTSLTAQAKRLHELEDQLRASAPPKL